LAHSSATFFIGYPFCSGFREQPNAESQPRAL